MWRHQGDNRILKLFLPSGLGRPGVLSSFVAFGWRGSKITQDYAAPVLTVAG